MFAECESDGPEQSSRSLLQDDCFPRQIHSENATHDLQMRMLLNAAIVFLLLTPALAHAQSHQPKEDKTKEEIQKLFSGLNEAITKKDRARLEQLYADEFQFIRPSGAVVKSQDTGAKKME